MKTKIIICLAALLGVAAVDVAKKQFELPKARLTIKVADEQGNPVSGAGVNLVFQNPITREGMPIDGLTDASGIFSAEGGSNSRVGGNVQKEGYYRAGFPFKDFQEVKDGHWLPWDATYQSILRPIGRPIELYAKSGWIEVPMIGQPCGYDLAKGDWVAPYGKGQIADFVFTVERRYESIQDFEMKAELGFSNPQDGIQAAQMPEVGRYSVFKWLREASDSDYKPALSLHFSYTNDRTEESATEQQNYFFRVRTVEQNGHLVSGLYGKIKGGLFLAPMHSKTCKIQLTYYLNPTSLDRNLEWDTTRNLLQGLSREETPTAP